MIDSGSSSQQIGRTTKENTRRKRTCEKKDSRKMVGSFNERDEEKSEEEKQSFSLLAFTVCLRWKDFSFFFIIFDRSL